jgi:hypothetical protein
MKMVCRLHSTSFIVSYIIVGSDSSYVNEQRSSPHWHCPINNANKTIVEIWTSKCWIKVNAYDFSAGGVDISPGSMKRPVVYALALTSYIRYIAYRNLQFLNHVIIVITKVLPLNHVIIVITKVLLLNHVIIAITKVLLPHMYVTVPKSCNYCYI